MSRPPKKSETLEIRVPHQTKAAFMARCRREGLTASEAVRRYIEGEIGGKARATARGTAWRFGQALAAALAGLLVGALAAPSLAHPTACAPIGSVAASGPTAD